MKMLTTFLRTAAIDGEPPKEVIGTGQGGGRKDRVGVGGTGWGWEGLGDGVTGDWSGTLLMR